jgi:ectoine hydroxylase-related dioxygenase (phytanoyl-CoA dioxygenase family)
MGRAASRQSRRWWSDAKERDGMTEREQHLTELEVYGFTVVYDVLGAADVAAMKDVLIREDAARGELTHNRGVARKLPNLATLDPVFFKSFDHRRVLPLLEHFLEETLILGSSVARVVRPGDPQQGLHSDIPPEMLNLSSPVMMNSAWLLDDFSAASGGTRFVPGSHANKYADPPEGSEVKHVAQPAAPAGSVIVFSGQIWHGGGANSSAPNRYGILNHYRKHWLVFQWDPHDDFPPEWLEQLSPRQRQLLRMTHGVGAPHTSEEHFLRKLAEAQ